MTMVVAWERRVTESGAIWYSSIAARVPSMTAAPKSLGVVETLAIPARPLASSSTATSVNVPPISTPIRQPIRSCLLRSASSGRRPRARGTSRATPPR